MVGVIASIRQFQPKYYVSKTSCTNPERIQTYSFQWPAGLDVVFVQSPGQVVVSSTEKAVKPGLQLVGVYKVVRDGLGRGVWCLR